MIACRIHSTKRLFAFVWFCMLPSLVLLASPARADDIGPLEDMFCLVDPTKQPEEGQVAYRNCRSVGSSAFEANCEIPGSPAGSQLINTRHFERVPQTKKGSCGASGPVNVNPYEDGIGNAPDPKNWPKTSKTKTKEPSKKSKKIPINPW